MFLLSLCVFDAVGFGVADDEVEAFVAVEAVDLHFIDDAQGFAACVVGLVEEP